ncbi:YlbF family regulator [Enterococcus rivorum]|uniref:Cell fate regulator YmcA, YheA/YmcA/DUF963 family (Controls sporulation, competence, biofilm development) n=1 Tax=Enterococcus rivorum TaxID=762845 RepID=A0A1E5KY98_9ENTE|nr:YlbF family regulator [Enterococcus rivorum]MBP2099948.1 cell fate (sporulation/competence/biofilm development) regulator YmcA (YheA/YmcA/DUF963 family) [Enterococcus rivorum]OEH82836.1 hypothetical protein BCR26_11460 [Enterococcus rivorum]
MKPSTNEEKINYELERLLALIEENETIQQYKKLEVKVQKNEKLTALVEQIKQAQKDAVQFAHYNKPEAEREALKLADQLTKEFDEHPLVIAYREQLVEANDLLQHITDQIQYKVNEELEKEGL